MSFFGTVLEKVVGGIRYAISLVQNSCKLILQIANVILYGLLRERMEESDKLCP